MIHIWRPWKLSNFQYPQPSCSSTFKNLPAHWPWTSNFKLSPPSPNGNQSNQIKHNPRTTLICYQVLPSAFIFSINSLFSSSFHLTFLHLAEAFFVALQSCVWSCPKYYEMYFICTKLKQKQTMEQKPHRACEQTKSKQKVMSYSNQALVPLFDLPHKQCNGIIKGWLHCLTSESKGRFLVNNKLY